jgi:hypothetical protein
MQLDVARTVLTPAQKAAMASPAGCVAGISCHLDQVLELHLGVHAHISQQSILQPPLLTSVTPVHYATSFFSHSSSSGKSMSTFRC